jgi:hypothetical protein
MATALIAANTPQAGLRVKSQLHSNQYPAGIKVSHRWSKSVLSGMSFMGNGITAFSHGKIQVDTLIY